MATYVDDTDQMTSLWLFRCEKTGMFLVRVDNYENTRTSGPGSPLESNSYITLRDPIADRNEIFCLEHATSYERALDWILWMKDEGHERHGELDPELKVSDLAYVVPIEFRILE